MIHRDVAGFHFKVECPRFAVHGAHEPLSERWRVPVDHEVANNNVLARVQSEKPGRWRAYDDLRAVAIENHPLGLCHGQGIVDDLGVRVRFDVGIQIVPAFRESDFRRYLRLGGQFHGGANPRHIVPIVVRHGAEVRDVQYLLDGKVA